MVETLGGGALHLLGLVGEVVWELVLGAQVPPGLLKGPLSLRPLLAAGLLVTPSLPQVSLAAFLRTTLTVVTVTIRLLLWPPHWVWEPGD